MEARRGDSPIVLDLGSDTLRIGHAGEENPQAALHSVIGAESVSSGDLRWFPLHPAAADPQLEARTCLRYSDGDTIQPELDLEALDALLHLSLGKLQNTSSQSPAKRQCTDRPLLGRFDRERTPILLSEPNSPKTLKMREAIVERIFEHFGVHSVCFEKSAPLSCYSFGRSTGLVLDAGAGLTSVTPVYDGEVLSNSLRETPFAGTTLNHSLLNALGSQGVEIQPVFPRSRPTLPEVPGGMSASHWRYETLRLAQDMKESICFCSHVPLASAEPKAPFPHELPDGQKVDVAKFSCVIPEKLLVGDSPGESQSSKSAPSLIADSLALCSESGDSLVRDLVSSILLVGGSSHFVNFKSRLEASLWGESLHSNKNLALHARRAKVHFCKERRHSAWTGGSILGELGTRGERWLTRADYDEKGSSAVAQHWC